jgi:SAM-dependent methyltransferase
MTSDNASDEELWDARYGSSERVWSGKPNIILVREVTGVKPGAALDLGCGEGADAIWLAQQGWRVTAVDISRVALDRAARHAEEMHVGERIDWQRHDLAMSFPAGTFDLVSAQFLHSSADLPRERILRTAVSAVAPGGLLLIVGHAGHPPWEHHHHPDMVFPTADEVIDSLDLPDGQWEVQLRDEHQRSQNGPDGKPAVRTDNTVKLRRLDV